MLVVRKLFSMTPVMSFLPTKHLTTVSLSVLGCEAK